MTAVFSHGRLRLYLLKLLAEGPKHGYELIRLLENRFLGLYAPSAGTIYPRLQHMEVEGLVTHTAAGGRKTYEITAAGKQELQQRSGELATLEAEIRALVADLSSLATEIQNEVRGSVRDIKRELREQARLAQTRRWERQPAPPGEPGGAGQDRESGEVGEAGEASAQAAATLDRLVDELVVEVRRLAGRPGTREETLRTVNGMLQAALAVLRRR